MPNRFNLALINFLKSLVRISILFVLLSIVLPLFYLQDILGISLILLFAFLGLLISSCVLIKSKALRIILTIFTSLIALASGVVYLPLDLAEILTMEGLGQVILHLLACIICIVSGSVCGDYENYAVNKYDLSVKLFKGFTIFCLIAIILQIASIFFIDYNIVQNAIIETSMYTCIFVVTDIALIKTERQAIYIAVKSEKGNSSVYRYLIANGVALGSGALFFIFTDRLDVVFFTFVHGIRGIFDKVVGVFQNFIEFIKSAVVQSGIDIVTNQNGTPQRIPEEVIDDVLNDFGVDPDFKVNPDDIPDEIGGIGSISGFKDSIHGGANDLKSYAGLIGAPLSEKGAFGVGGGNGTITGNASAVAVLRSEKDGNIYLKLKSFGDYIKTGFSDADDSGYWISNKEYGMNYLTGLALSGRYNDGEAIRLDISSLTEQYFLPDYLAIGNYGYNKQVSDVYNSAGETADSTDYIYTVGYYNHDNFDIDSTIPFKYYDIETSYSAFVKDNYLALPSDTRQKVLEFLAKNNIHVGDSDAVQKINTLLSGYTFNLSYDKVLDKEEDVVVSFLTEYKQGSSQHFAAAGTVMLRALGIPARYVGGLYVGEVKAGDWQVVTSNAAHVWTEYYKDRVGWVRSDFTLVAIGQENRYKATYAKTEYKEIIEDYKHAIQNSGAIGGGNNDQQGGDQTDDESQGNLNGDLEIGEGTNSSIIESIVSDCSNNVKPTITIVSGALMVATVVVLISVIIKKSKLTLKKLNKQKNKAKTQEKLAKLQEKENKLAIQKVKDAYKDFILLISKNGIPIYPVDTTTSIKDKYFKAICESSAVEELTGIYRTARYDKNQKINTEDVENALKCIEIIKKEIERKTYDKE